MKKNERDLRTHSLRRPDILVNFTNKRSGTIYARFLKGTIVPTPENGRAPTIFIKYYGSKKNGAKRASTTPLIHLLTYCYVL